MATVTIQINGQPYAMACAPGEEEQLHTIARVLDREVGRVKASAGAVDDLRLLLMAGLMLSDRVALAEQRVRQLQDELAQMTADEAGDEARAARAAMLLARAAARLEDIARE